jgi:hypothetical protein
MKKLWAEKQLKIDKTMKESCEKTVKHAEDLKVGDTVYLIKMEDNSYKLRTLGRPATILDVFGHGTFWIQLDGRDKICHRTQLKLVKLTPTKYNYNVLGRLVN